MELNICHLYPDVLNLYGDRGNVLCLKKRLEWRGITARVTEVPIGSPLKWQNYDIFFIGGGQDFEQGVLLEDLAGGKGQAIIDAVENGRVFLAICGGYQMLGKYYKTWDGRQCNFIGAVDVWTIGEKERMIGNFMYQMEPEDGGSLVVGFENHSGKTYLGKGVRPMGKLLAGKGNNGDDGTEGARYKNTFCTYSHGPVLPKNPQLCDELLRRALKNKYGLANLPALTDSFEKNANSYMVKRLSE